MAFPVSFVLFIVATGVLGFAVAARIRGRAMRPRLLLDIGLAACLTAVLVLTVTPYPGRNELQLVPFAHLVHLFRPPINRKDVLLNTVGNVLFFLPFGAALCLRGCTIGKTVLSGVALSVGLEITQRSYPDARRPSTTCYSNTLGAVLGHALLSRWAPSRSPSSDAGGHVGATRFPRK